MKVYRIMMKGFNKFNFKMISKILMFWQIWIQLKIIITVNLVKNIQRCIEYVKELINNLMFITKWELIIKIYLNFNRSFF